MAHVIARTTKCEESGGMGKHGRAKEATEKYVERAVHAGRYREAIVRILQTTPGALSNYEIGLDEVALASVPGVGSRRFYAILSHFGTAQAFLDQRGEGVPYFDWRVLDECVSTDNADRIRAVLVPWIQQLRAAGFGPTAGGA